MHTEENSTLKNKQKFHLGEWNINEKELKFKNKTEVSEAIFHCCHKGKSALILKYLLLILGQLDTCTHVSQS